MRVRRSAAGLNIRRQRLKVRAFLVAQESGFVSISQSCLSPTGDGRGSEPRPRHLITILNRWFSHLDNHTLLRQL